MNHITRLSAGPEGRSAVIRETQTQSLICPLLHEAWSSLYLTDLKYTDAALNYNLPQLSKKEFLFSRVPSVHFRHERAHRCSAASSRWTGATDEGLLKYTQHWAQYGALNQEPFLTQALSALSLAEIFLHPHVCMVSLQYEVQLLMMQLTFRHKNNKWRNNTRTHNQELFKTQMLEQTRLLMEQLNQFCIRFMQNVIQAQNLASLFPRIFEKQPAI